LWPWPDGLNGYWELITKIKFQIFHKPLFSKRADVIEKQRLMAKRQQSVGKSFRSVVVIGKFKWT